ncbi:MAG: heat-stable protein [Candidatus Angelobacter sp.]
MNRLSKIIAAAGPKGNVEAVRQIGEQAKDIHADAVFLVGSLTPKSADPREYGRVLNALGETRLPAFYVPGSDDAPFGEFLREAANIEIVFPNIHCVHGTFAMAPGHEVVTGLGGTILDDMSAVRDEIETLRYPGWEVEYRLKFLNELKDYPRIFLFTTSPEHKGLHEKGSSVVAEVIKTHKPRLALVGGREHKREMIGTSLLIGLGSLAEGVFTVIDLRTNEAKPGVLRHTASAA